MPSFGQSQTSHLLIVAISTTKFICSLSSKFLRSFIHIKEHSVPALIISLSIVQTQLTYKPSSNIKIVNFRQYSTIFMFCTYIVAGSKGKIENFFRAKKYWSKLKQKSRGFQIHPSFKLEKIWVIFKSTVSDPILEQNIFPGLIPRSKFDPGKCFFQMC